MKYTEEQHAQHLLCMLERPDPCNCCPGALYLSRKINPENGACKICWNFLGKEEERGHCPCTRLGEARAIKETWIALEKKGYIKEGGNG